MIEWQKILIVNTLQNQETKQIAIMIYAVHWPYFAAVLSE